LHAVSTDVDRQIIDPITLGLRNSRGFEGTTHARLPWLARIRGLRGFYARLVSSDPLHVQDVLTVAKSSMVSLPLL